ncbi:sulfur carrier protein ThiS [Pusillimonas sp. DMV24BSW_D]|uniref:sulfur carrier protein ThiS n=1 Tax=Neopusillimonas aestuarii TaxID=2716226 RepID=UPI000C94F50F|nr:sulfur carrier protein ThiS [Pusillimonas sp. DMV24BSW_D]MAK54764.1 thiamine biosynthesis protein ThiS [Pusillimonas sp.]MAO50813.1 thiamine biosynthesis protein ThiS [Pusillimonas sp.]QIM50294.1 sulfur carrier protein ThiS [Pusillimonas sp. DMV24BSW_D]HCP78307.1 thiamine biosynthesis protein ThiS [Pusillimonas sp.]|tara:strand:- start:5623 stop:5823 length:201 start_codon:yes stop_codon:yes gene_type:complete
MKITLNGEPTPLNNVQTVADLIRHMGWEGKRIAVERNGEIVPKSQHAQEALADGDEIEIVVAVGGG